MTVDLKPADAKPRADSRAPPAAPTSRSRWRPPAATRRRPSAPADAAEPAASPSRPPTAEPAEPTSPPAAEAAGRPARPAAPRRRLSRDARRRRRALHALRAPRRAAQAAHLGARRARRRRARGGRVQRHRLRAAALPAQAGARACDAAAYKITTFSPAEPFMVSLKIWVVVGIMLASPFLIWQLWAYVGPAFTSTEKRYFYPVVIATTAALPRRRRLRLPRRAAQGPAVPARLRQRQLQHPEPGQRLLHLRGALRARLRRRSSRCRSSSCCSPRWASSTTSSCARTAATRSSSCAIVAAVITPSQDAFSMLAMFIPLRGPLRDLHPARPPGAAEEARPTPTPEDAGDDPDDLSRAPA